MADPFQKQQTAKTISENFDNWAAGQFKKTPEETDANIKAYFAEKAAKAAKREAKGGQK